MVKQKKCFAACLLALLIMFSTVSPVTAESYTVEVPPALLGSYFSMPAAEWYGEDPGRMLLAACTMIEVVNLGDETLNNIMIQSMWGNRTCVTLETNGEMLYVIYFGDTTCLTMKYAPSTGYRYCFLVEMPYTSAGTLLSELTANGTINSYFILNGENLWSMYGIVKETIGLGPAATVKPENPNNSGTSEDECSYCYGSGECDHCFGEGSEWCDSCLGSGSCDRCDGFGTTFPNDKRCTRCSGSGVCRTCDGSGYIECNYCDGSGDCFACDGLGTR